MIHINVLAPCKNILESHLFSISQQNPYKTTICYMSLHKQHL